ncbi:phosphatase and actin regulator 2 isoform X4 [Melospiza melodia melodia]|uniref:phosphatase and actin regulator 2 isoform X4 n=1 Tax=Melospiza melodia melodia TaxID=1914991 RepID=UPI002FCF80B4
MAERPGSSGTAPLPVWSLPGPRGRSQSDISSFSSSRRTCLLRSNVGGSVDGLDKASIANSDGPAPGSQTPPFKRKGKLSNIGKIFKPWKWRKKKTSDKFRETSAVLERKISTRQSREELIRRGVLKEMPEQDGDVTVNFETSNGHTVAIGEETIQEENLVKASGNNGTLSEKASASEGKKEDQKAGSSHAKKLPVSKSSSSPSPSSTSSHPKASKETSSKSGTSGTPRGKKKPGKQSAPRTAPDGAASSPSGATADSVAAKAEKPKAEQTPTVTFDMDNADQPSKLVVPPPPTAAPPPPPLPPPFPAAAPQQPAGSSDGQDVSDSPVAGPPGSDTKALLPTERGTDPSPSSAAPGSAPGARGDRTESLAPKEDQEGEAPDEAFSELVEEASDAAAPPESESSRDSHGSDSDSDGPILYTDDDDDDDDDDDENASTESSLASKIRRRDTLAIKLGNRPSKKELEDKNILQRTSEEERQEIRHQIGTKLVRRLSQRPTTEELEQRNILKQKNEEEEQEAKREIKRRLSRKLSLRPTVAELQARRILRFNEYVEVTESPDYDRRADKPWARLTPADKAAIRKELNEFKSTEMEVHEESRQFTRFHRP